MEIKKLIAELSKKTNLFVMCNIFKSVENVNLDTVVGYKAKGVRHNFLDTTMIKMTDMPEQGILRYKDIEICLRAGTGSAWREF